MQRAKCNPERNDEWKSNSYRARDLAILVPGVMKKKRMLKPETWSNLERDQIFNQRSGGFLC